ncbi:MAG: nitroreductase [bacterium]|nr:nitroreductase [bacterium]
MAVYAPSGDNSQPWEFKIGPDFIEIFNLPDRDNAFYNYEQRGSLVAHGALLENICIAAPAQGYRTIINLFPLGEENNLVARVEFHPTESVRHPLLEAIKARTTNRKLYRKDKPLTGEQVHLLQEAHPDYSAGRVFLVDDRTQMDLLGKAVSVNEVVALENKKLHDIFFQGIVWTAEEEKEKKRGLYLKTMELPLPMAKIFPLFKRWPIVNVLNKIGFAKMAAKGNASIYSSGSAIGLVVIPSRSAIDYIWAGRLMQRTWLTATQLGLSFQPVTGVLFLMQRILTGATEGLEDKHIKALSSSYEVIKRAFNINNETAAILFRVGYGDFPSARSSRLPPRII